MHGRKLLLTFMIDPFTKIVSGERVGGFLYAPHIMTVPLSRRLSLISHMLIVGKRNHIMEGNAIRVIDQLPVKVTGAHRILQLLAGVP